MQLTCCAHNQLFKLCAGRCCVLCSESRPVLSCSPGTGHRGLHHPPPTRPPPLASLGPSLTSSHSTPSLSSSRGLSTSCHRPAPGHQVHSLHILAALLTPSCPRPPPVPPPPAPGPRPIENVGELPEITFVRIILNFQ